MFYSELSKASCSFYLLISEVGGQNGQTNWKLIKSDFIRILKHSNLILVERIDQIGQNGQAKINPNYFIYSE